MACVSAADDGDLVQESADDVDLQMPVDNDELSDVEMDLNPEETFEVGAEESVTLSIPYGIEGNLTVKINGTAGGLEYDEYDDYIYVYSSGHSSKLTLPFGEDIDYEYREPADYEISFDQLTPGKTYEIVFTFTPTSGQATTFSSMITLVGEGQTVIDDVEIFAEEAYICNKLTNRINITVPQSLVSGVDVRINGVKYNLIKLDDDEYYVDISQLPLGMYTIVVYYGEDSVNESFEVVNAIEYPVEMTYGTTAYVILMLSSDANGNLTVKIDDKLIGNVKLVEGYAQIPISPLSAGQFSIEAKYLGEDYDIDDIDDVIEVKPKITFPSEMGVGEDKYFIIEVGESEGILNIQADYEQYSLIRIQGSAEVSLKNLKNGQITIDISYIDDDSYRFEDEFEINVVPAPIKIVANNVNVVYTKSGVFKVKIYGHDAKPVANDVIDSIAIGNKVYSYVKTDAYGVATVKIPNTFAPGKYDIKITFEKVVAKNTLTVKHLLSLNKVSVKKSAKKLVLKATLKNLKSKKVVFKFNGKKYTAKTNKKGIAKVTIDKSVLSKLKVGKKVKYQATYLKDTVKKSVKVKK